MAARASLFRTESRWGLYHARADYPDTDDERWFCHAILYKGANGTMCSRKRPVAPYLVEIGDDEMGAYRRLRVPSAAAAE